MGTRVGADLLDALVRSILLFVMLWIAGVLWADFGVFFGAANSFYFGLAYLVAHVASVLLRDMVYHRSEVGSGRPRSTA